MRYAKKHGVETVKLNGMGKRSHPDRMFLYAGRVRFVEFKRRGAQATPLQRELHKRWKKLGHPVYVADNVVVGCAIINRLVSP